MGFLFGLLIKVALPEDLLGGHDSPNLKYLDLIVPYAVATGICAAVKPLLYVKSAAWKLHSNLNPSFSFCMRIATERT